MINDLSNLQRNYVLVSTAERSMVSICDSAIDGLGDSGQISLLLPQLLLYGGPLLPTFVCPSYKLLQHVCTEPSTI